MGRGETTGAPALDRRSPRDPRLGVSAILAATMPRPAPDEHSQGALRSLIWRVVVILIAAIVVIASFGIAWRLGLFAPSRQ
jgi:hypothetical protein